MNDRPKRSGSSTRVWTPSGSRPSRRGSGQSDEAQSRRPRSGSYRGRQGGYSRDGGARGRGGPRGRSQGRGQQRLSPKERRKKKEGFGRLYVDKQIREETPMVFETYDGSVEAVIAKRLCYDLDLYVNGEKERLNKLPIKFMYKKKDEEAVREHLAYNEVVKDKELDPIKPRVERFQIDTRHLGYARQKEIPIRVTLRGGEVFEGLIDWYSHFEIKMTLDKEEDASVVVFRHAACAFELEGGQTPPPPPRGGPRGGHRGGQSGHRGRQGGYRGGPRHSSNR